LQRQAPAFGAGAALVRMVVFIVCLLVSNTRLIAGDSASTFRTVVRSQA
jgi:hypothetical protein